MRDVDGSAVRSRSAAKEARKAHSSARPGTADAVEKPKPKLTQKTFNWELKRSPRELVLMQEHIRERRPSRHRNSSTTSDEPVGGRTAS